MDFFGLFRSIKKLYVTCRYRKASSIQPIITDLPIKSLEYKQPPFNDTGVDYFGPLYVPVRRITEKFLGFVNNCRTTWAVHLLIVSSLDTSSCVMGIERFIARQGTPSTFWSDSLARKKNYMPASRTETAWLRSFLHTIMLLGN